MNATQTCPECGQGLPENAPEGLCPHCLLGGAIERGVVEDRTLERTTPISGARPGEFVAPAPEQLAPSFPQFEIVELLGRGGMGAVYKARQPKLDRLVAIKILPAEMASDPSFAERFNREARALARLNHPHIVAVHDFGQAGNLFFVVMEYVDGVNLREAIAQRRLSPTEALAIVGQICDALQFAHEEHVVHRDIKPENILLDKRGRVKIADFGLAKLVSAEPGNATLTQTRQVMGTMQYMAPEQLGGSRRVDHRADLYSLGVVFYELLTGELPVGRFPLPSKSAAVDSRLDDVVLRALEREPEARYQHASEIKSDVDEIRSSPEIVPAKPVLSDVRRLPAAGRWKAPLMIAAGVLLLGLGGMGFTLLAALLGFSSGTPVWAFLFLIVAAMLVFFVVGLVALISGVAASGGRGPLMLLGVALALMAGCVVLPGLGYLILGPTHDYTESRHNATWDVEAKESSEDMLVRMAAQGDKNVFSAGLSNRDPNFKNFQGITPLMAAAANGHSDLVASIVSLGAVVDDRDPNGQTALMQAAHRGHVAAVQTLLSFNASVNAMDHRGLTALDYAVAADQTAAIEMLIKANATPTGPYLLAEAHRYMAAQSHKRALERIEEALAADNVARSPWVYQVAAWRISVPNPKLYLYALALECVQRQGDQQGAQRYFDLIKQSKGTRLATLYTARWLSPESRASGRLDESNFVLDEFTINDETIAQLEAEVLAPITLHRNRRQVISDGRRGTDSSSGGLVTGVIQTD
jgi:tRNA A-37 threonylcarbamoyl transferase component Bud32